MEKTITNRLHELLAGAPGPRFLLKNENDTAIALIGFTAYTKEGETDFGKRPVTFAYNGGPGSSSMWLHMGAVGPKNVLCLMIPMQSRLHLMKPRIIIILLLMQPTL